MPVILKVLRQTAVWPPAMPGQGMADMLKPFGPAGLKGLLELMADENETVSMHASRVLVRMGLFDEALELCDGLA